MHRSWPQNHYRTREAAASDSLESIWLHYVPSSRAHDRLTRDPLVRQRPHGTPLRGIYEQESLRNNISRISRETSPAPATLDSGQCANSAKRPARRLPLCCPYTDPGTWRGTSSVLDDSAGGEAEFCPDRPGIPAADWSLRQGNRRRQRRPNLDPGHHAFPYVRCSWNKERNKHSAGYPVSASVQAGAQDHSGTASASR